MPAKLNRLCLTMALKTKSVLQINSHILKPKNYLLIDPNRHCLFATSSFARNVSNDQLVDQTINSHAKIDYVNGLIKLTITLPARNEKCEFSLKLLNDTVGTLVDFLKHEDKSIEKAQVFNLDGTRISQNTAIGSIVTNPFKIRINDTFFHLEPPSLLAKQTVNDLEDQAKKDLEEIKQLVSKLYLHLNIEQYETTREDKIVKQLELLKTELGPMEKTRQELALKAKKHTNRMVWLGLGLMSIQVGILARLTWFDYSWDIVEPISYFVSYSSVIGVYAYFVLTRKEYDYESATDRIFLRNFHKNAIKNNLDVNKYNEKKNTVYQLENELKRIKEIQMKNYQESSKTDL